MNDNTQSRKWLLTINNPEKYGFTHDNIRAALSTIKNISYWCMCDEIGKEGTYHTHLFIYRENQMRFSQIKKKFPTAHIDYCQGTTQENREYILKGEKHKDKQFTHISSTFEEFGECPIEEQGKRNDLNELYRMIKDGLSDYDIIESNPKYMIQFNKIDRCRQVLLEEKFKNTFRELTVEYWYGDTGQGKTRTVMDRYGYENVYRVTNYKYPFDGYKGQDVLVFEEFYNSIRIQEMLTYLDGYPLELPCRYNNKIACYTKVFILSNVDLNEQYRDIFREHPETFRAFQRRISCIKYFGKDGLKDYKTIDEYEKSSDRFVSVEDYEQVDIPFD